MKFQVIVEIDTHCDKSQHSESAQSVQEFMVQEVIAGRRKATSKFMRARCSMRVVAAQPKKLKQPYPYV